MPGLGRGERLAGEEAPPGASVNCGRACGTVLHNHADTIPDDTGRWQGDSEIQWRVTSGEWRQDSWHESILENRTADPSSRGSIRDAKCASSRQVGPHRDSNAIGGRAESGVRVEERQRAKAVDTDMANEPGYEPEYTTSRLMPGEQNEWQSRLLPRPRPRASHFLIGHRRRQTLPGGSFPAFVEVGAATKLALL